MGGPDDILKFWLDDVGPTGWYTQSDALDKEIAVRFRPMWEAANDGAYSMWLTYPTGALVYIILLDQFPRNMFRDDARAFATDKAALAMAKIAVSKNWDLKIDEPARQFFYLPMMHSENLRDQERCIRLMKDRMPGAGDGNLIHAKAHREIIRKFGRFPYRNAALQRKFTAPEQDYVSRGGYGETVRQLQAG